MIQTMKNAAGGVVVGAYLLGVTAVVFTATAGIAVWHGIKNACYQIKRR
jgi:hypothetical protein